MCCRRRPTTIRNDLPGRTERDLAALPKGKRSYLFIYSFFFFFFFAFAVLLRETAVRVSGLA
jgi:hypothetical protein